MEKKKNVFEMVTERIVNQLNAGVIPWHRPWTGVADGAISHESGKPYSFVNQMLLGIDGEWLTHRQIENEGGKVRKGEEASFVVFWKQMQYEEENEDGTKEIKTVPVLRYYNVWHISQTEGIKAKYTELKPRDTKSDESADKVVANYIKREGIVLHNDKPSNRAFYRPSDDMIVTPMISQFEETAEYYSTLFHEITHSTGHESRLKRLTKMAAFGSENYSKEELVAEMGAAYLCTTLGIDTDKAFKNSAAYIQGWLRALKNDSKMIVRAAAKAEQAVNYILNKK